MPCSLNNVLDSLEAWENITAAAAEGGGGLKMFQDTFRKLQGDKEKDVAVLRNQMEISNAVLRVL